MTSKLIHHENLSVANHETRSVLYVAHTPVSLRTIQRVHQLINSDSRISFSLTLGPDQFNDGMEEAMTAWGIPIVEFDDATRQKWDLVVFANHGGSHQFEKANKTVFISHGVGNGKLALGQDYTYGERWVLRDGQPIYSAMFEASKYGKRRAQQITPEISDRVIVVGDLETDHYLKLRQHQHLARAILGCVDEEILLISATWGEHSVLATYPDLLASAADLPPNVTVFLKAHPHNWNPDGTPRRHLARALDAAAPNVRVMPAWQSWLAAYAAADWAVYDTGSLALRFALSPRPMVATPVPDGVVTPGSPLAKLRSMTPLLRSPDLLEARNLASRVTNQAQLQNLRPLVVSKPGKASARTYCALYKLLNLEQLPSTRGEVS